jgi:putative transcriptional regulator
MRMKTDYALRNRVKELRARLNLRQADLAREVEVTRQTILAIEKGRLNPSIMLSLRIARVLREPVDYIFYLDRSEEEYRSAKEARRRETLDTTRAVYEF